MWSAACASGEEAYSLAILLHTLLGDADVERRIKVYATDVDDQALAVARQGRYRPDDLAGLTPEQRETCVEPDGSLLRFRSDLRPSLVFGRHDLLQDAPILGKAEMLLTQSQLFTPVSLSQRIFWPRHRPGAGRLPRSTPERSATSVWRSGTSAGASLSWRCRTGRWSCATSPGHPRLRSGPLGHPHRAADRRRRAAGRAPRLRRRLGAARAHAPAGAPRRRAHHGVRGAVDTDYRVQLWNGGAERLTGLRAFEAEGRRLLELDLHLPVAPVRAVLRSVVVAGKLPGPVDIDVNDRFGRAQRRRLTATPLVRASRVDRVRLGVAPAVHDHGSEHTAVTTAGPPPGSLRATDVNGG